MSNLATSWPSRASNFAVIKTDSVATVGESTSSILIFYHFFLPSANARPFMSPFWFSFRKISDSTTSVLCFLVSLVESTGAKVSRTWSCVSSFVNYALDCSLNLFSPVLVHIVSWWCGACDFNFLYLSYLALLRLCSGGCAHYHEFYLLVWVLVWSLVSCLWLGILQNVPLMFLLPIQIWFTLHCCPHHWFLLILGMVCLPLQVLLPQLRHNCQHSPNCNNHHHCLHVHRQVPPQVLYWFWKGGWERWCHYTLLWYL